MRRIFIYRNLAPPATAHSMLPFVGILLVLLALPVARAQQCDWSLDEFPVGINPGVAGLPAPPCDTKVWNIQQVSSGVDSNSATTIQTWNGSFIGPSIGAWIGTEVVQSAQSGTLPAVLRNMGAATAVFDAIVFGYAHTDTNFSS